MKKVCNLIATIPAMTDLKKVENIISCPFIYGVRWNTGIVSPYSEKETLEILKRLTDKYKKKFWVDLKGRQLRVIEWGNPLYSTIKVNHKLSVDLPAIVCLRGEKPLQLVKVKENELYVNPLPVHAVGVGQSVNVLGKNLNIDGYLTEKDIIYLNACKELQIKDIMASFVEEFTDIAEIKMVYDDCNIVCKMESVKGCYNLSDFEGFNLMAARDDLYIEVENPYYMYMFLNRIIRHDANAICASRIFTSLEHSSKISFSDFEDMETMYNMGYRNFMLCDNVSNYKFEDAIMGWRIFLNG